jgi:hypothetical protein
LSPNSAAFTGLAAGIGGRSGAARSGVAPPPAPLDVFGRLVDRLPNLRALLVVTFRPESPRPGWAKRM